MQPKMTVSEASALLNITPQAVHARIKSQNLPVDRINNAYHFGHETARELFNINFSPKTYVLHNIKGGVGKTELAYNLGIKMALYGARVLCIDLDLQGNLSIGCFKISAKDRPIMVDVVRGATSIKETITNIIPGLDLIPSDLNNSVLDNILMFERHPLNIIYKDYINQIRTQYDIILIDCPPALTASVTAASLAADAVIAPVTPDEHSIAGLNLLYAELRELERKYKISIPLRVVFNKFDARSNLSHEKLNFLRASDRYSPLLYQSYVRISQDFPNATDNGLSIYDNLRKSTAKEDIDLLAQEILGL